MIASVHIADLGPRRAVPLLTKRLSKLAVPGLRHANIALGARLGAPLPTKTQAGRIALVAMWDDDAVVDRFLADSPVAAAFAPGWHVRLEPLRAWGSWPGLDADISKSRAATSAGPVAVLTLARTKITRLVPFLCTSGKAEKQAVGAPGLVWGTALVSPPFVATCSLWESAEASAAYAFTAGHAHNDAIATGRAKPFHHQEAFVRFRPYASAGHLDGRNPLPESLLAGV